MLKTIILSVLLMAVGIVTFLTGAMFQSVASDLSQDGMTWLWNLGCTGMMVSGILIFFIPGIYQILKHN